jgi:hypothetical protein
MTSTLHRWSSKDVVSLHKTDRECRRSGLVKVTRHEFEGRRDLHWQEFWRDLDRVDDGRSMPTYDARTGGAGRAMG